MTIPLATNDPRRVPASPPLPRSQSCVRAELRLTFESPEKAIRFTSSLASLFYASASTLTVRSSTGSRRDDLTAAEIDYRLEAGLAAGLEIVVSLGGSEAEVEMAQDPERPCEVALDLPLSPLPVTGRHWLQCDPEAISPIRALALPVAAGALTPEALHALIGLALRVGGFAGAVAKADDEQAFEWHPSRPEQDAAPIEASLVDTTWTVGGEAEAAEAWFVTGQRREPRRPPDETWWNAFDEFTAAPRSSLPELREHLALIFKVPFDWEIDELSNAPEASDAITPEAGVIGRLVPTDDKLLLAVDFEQPASDVAEALLHLCGHAELGHVQPGDTCGHWDTAASVRTASGRRRWDHEVARHLQSYCPRPSTSKASSIDDCTPVEKARLGLWHLIGETLGENRELHPTADQYQSAAYQRQAAQRIVSMLEDYGGAMLCDGVGLGKTYVATTLMVHYANAWRDAHKTHPDHARTDPFRITVLAPNSVVSTWRREAIPPLSAIGVPLSTVRVISHSKMSRISRTSSLLQPRRDGAMSDVEFLLLSDLVLVDEAHNFRSLAARRTKVLRDLLRLQPRKEVRRRVVLLTATPINNSLDDLRQETALLFSQPLWLGDARTDEGYRRQAVREISTRCAKARSPAASRGDVAGLIVHGQPDAGFSDTIYFREEDDLFGPRVARIGDYLKEQDKKLRALQDTIRTAARAQKQSDEEHEPVRIAEELLDRIVVQRSRALCKDIERQQGSNMDLLFRPDQGPPEKLYYSDEYDGIEDVLARFLPLFDTPNNHGHGDRDAETKPLSLKVYMWYDVREGIKTADETSSVVGLQRVLVLKRLESSPVSFLITLLRLTVLHAHRLQQLRKLCRDVPDRDRIKVLDGELDELLAGQSTEALAKIRSLATGDAAADPRAGFLEALSRAFSATRPEADKDDPSPQLLLFAEPDEDEPKREQLDRLWSLREALLDDLRTLFGVTPDLADIIFGRFDQAEWPRQFIAGGEAVDWPRSAGWGLRLITDAKLRCLVGRLLQARREGQKVIVFSQFSDTIAYIQSVLRACSDFSRNEWQMVLRGGLDVPELHREELVELLGSTSAITGGTADRDDAVDAFAPFYRIGPYRPVTERLGEAEQKQLLDEWEASWRQAIEHPRHVLISTDVLAEGVNLQDVTLLINFDVHWNPVRMIQRAGRIDRRLNPAIEKAAAFPELTALADKLGKPTPRYYFHDHPNEPPLTVNLILPDELEAELQLRERIAVKTLAIDFTLGLEQGTGAEADWMEDYKYQGISSLNSFQKDRAIEQVAGYHERLARQLASRGILREWAPGLNGWFREEAADHGSPLLGRGVFGRQGTHQSTHTRYLEPQVADGVPWWLWSQKKPGASVLNFWLGLDGKTFPAATRVDLHWSENASVPVTAHHLLGAAQRLESAALTELRAADIGRPLMQGITALSAGFLGTEADRRAIQVGGYFLLQLTAFSPDEEADAEVSGATRRGLVRPCKVCGHAPGMHKCCGRCRTSADGESAIEERFGFRKMSDSRGQPYEVPQPWCRACRAAGSLPNQGDEVSE